MEENSSTPVFTVGQETAAFLASCGILSKAWEESRLARNSESFSLAEHEGVAYVAFPSFHKIDCFIVNESKYGEGSIQTNNTVFSDSLKGDDDKKALVHQGALKLFLHILEKTDFQAKLQIYTDSIKPIIFVGHSLGGAVASLATLWVLEKQLRQCSPFCITFGCPLVGDVSLVEAVGRERWECNFLHVVSEHDIVPWMLLAPLQSIVEPLTAILPCWHDKVPDPSIQDACRTLLNNVLQYTNEMANCGVDSLRRSDGDRSPYRPFGTYMFCSSHGAASVGNSDTVLKMLHWKLRSLEEHFDNIAHDSILEHLRYDSVLKQVIENSITGRRFANPDSESSFEMGISLQLEAIGVGAQNYHAQLDLRRGGESDINDDKLAVELSRRQCMMAELEWYKDRCEKEDGVPYYESFREQNDKKDFRANVNRKILAQFWDKIIEMWESHELPSDFKSQNKWINAGNTYRLLVEPLDIAYYYRTSSNGNYLLDGRPNRHKVLQKWMEAKEKTRGSRGQRRRIKYASLTQDSCFWALLGEARKDLENLKQCQHERLTTIEEFKQCQHQRLRRLHQFEEHVLNMVKALNISSNVFLEKSSLMMWWEEWREYEKNQSSQ